MSEELGHRGDQIRFSLYRLAGQIQESVGRGRKRLLEREPLHPPQPGPGQESVVAAHFGVDPQSFRKRRGESVSRDVAAWLARELTSCTLRELAGEFGLGHPDSVRNLTRRIGSAPPESHKLRQDIAAIRRRLLITERT
jgi:hypothetical protein